MEVWPKLRGLKVDGSLSSLCLVEGFGSASTVLRRKSTKSLRALEV
jgi:hypothetical protein